MRAPGAGGNGFPLQNRLDAIVNPIQGLWPGVLWEPERVVHLIAWKHDSINWQLDAGVAFVRTEKHHKARSWELAAYVEIDNDADAVIIRIVANDADIPTRFEAIGKRTPEPRKTIRKKVSV